MDLCWVTTETWSPIRAENFMTIWTINPWRLVYTSAQLNTIAKLLELPSIMATFVRHLHRANAMGYIFTPSWGLSLLVPYYWKDSMRPMILGSLNT
jgi:hypothetical protein